MSFPHTDVLCATLVPALLCCHYRWCNNAGEAPALADHVAGHCWTHHHGGTHGTPRKGSNHGAQRTQQSPALLLLAKHSLTALGAFATCACMSDESCKPNDHWFVHARLLSSLCLALTHAMCRSTSSSLEFCLPHSSAGSLAMARHTWALTARFQVSCGRCF
jgi:hypothetical protein